MKKLRQALRAMMLRKMALANQRRSDGALDKADRIGVIYRADELGQNQEVFQWVRELQSAGKNVKTLGYIDAKTLPAHSVPNEKNDFFCRKDLNVFKLPKEQAIKRFTSEPFDLLINLYTEPDIMLLGVSSLSQSRVRVGPYFSEFTCCMDMMLETGEKRDLKTFIETVKMYLKQVL